MGLLRTLLALCVVAFHSGPILGFQSANGVLAVQAFYIVSGFYMSLILSERYVGRGAILAFYENRALRLFPIYWIVLIVTIAAAGLLAWFGLRSPITLWVQRYGMIGARESVEIVAANLFLFGQDILHFFAVDPNGHFVFDPLSQVKMRAWHYLIPIDQAWTLGVELLFYVFVPLLVRLPAIFLVGLFLLSSVVRLLTYQAGFNSDPWNYRFFPFELALFIAGMLAYRLYARMPTIKAAFASWNLAWLVPAFGWLATALLALYTVNFNATAVGAKALPAGLDTRRHWYFLLCVALLLPFIFEATKRSNIDDWIGSLSYPIYICHGLYVRIFATWVSAYGFSYGDNTALLSIITAIVLVRMTRPIERWRRSNAEHLNLSVSAASAN